MGCTGRILILLPVWLLYYSLFCPRAPSFARFHSECMHVPWHLVGSVVYRRERLFPPFFFSFLRPGDPCPEERERKREHAIAACYWMKSCRIRAGHDDRNYLVDDPGQLVLYWGVCTFKVVPVLARQEPVAVVLFFFFFGFRQPT